MTIEELQSLIEDLKSQNEAMNNKNSELLRELRLAKNKNKELDIETYNKVLDENETLKATLSKLDKESKSNIEKLSNDLSSKDKYLQKVLIEDGLTASLLKNGTKEEFLKPALALLKSEAKLVQGEDGTYQAFIGDKAMNDFIPDWLENGDGKFARPIPPTSGGGASGGASGSATSIGKIDGTKAEQEAYIKAKFNL